MKAPASRIYHNFMGNKQSIRILGALEAGIGSEVTDEAMKLSVKLKSMVASVDSKRVRKETL